MQGLVAVRNTVERNQVFAERVCRKGRAYDATHGAYSIHPRTVTVLKYFPVGIQHQQAARPIINSISL